VKLTSTTNPTRESSQILLLIGVDALFGFAIGFSSPSVAPLVFALGVTLTFVGQAQTVGGLGSTFLRLPVGVLMDRVGRKPFIVLGGLVTLLGYVSYSFANAWFLLGAGIAFVSLDLTIRGTAISASLGDVEKTGRLGRVFSLDLGVTETAATIAPLVGGYAATSLGVPTNVMFGSSAGIIVIALLIVWIFYKPAPLSRVESSERAQKWFTLPDRRILPILIIVAMDAFAWRISFPFWTLYVFKVLKASEEQLGITIAISAGIPALTGLTLGSKIDKVGRRPFLAASEWSAVGAFLPLLFGWRPEFAYVSAIFWGLVYSLWMPALNAYAVDHFGREKFGQTLGTMSLVSGIVSAASPILGGWMWDNISPKAPFAVTLILASVIGAIIWFKLGEKPSGM
jgi:DHA1 family multidrug resistance protein-like MFS transporter